MSDIQSLKEDVVHAGTIEDPIPQKLIFVKKDSTGAKKVYTLGMGGTTGGSDINVSNASDTVVGIVKLTDDATLDAPAATGYTALTPNGAKIAIETAKSEINQGIRDTVDEAIQDKIDSGEIGPGGGGTMAYVLTPTITTPAHDATNISTLPTIAATAYRNVFETDARQHRVFQVASDSSFGTLLVNQNVNADSYVVTTQLTPSTKLYCRVRDVAVSGLQSEWSPTVAFTTATGVVANTPVVTLHGYADSPTDILSGLRITTNEFSVTGGEDTHRATSWAIAPKDGTRANVWESLEDTTNKTSITVPDGTLQKGTAYTLSVTFHGTTSFDSSPAVVEFTTSADFGTVNAPTLTVEGQPSSVFSNPTLTGGAFSNTRDPDTHDKTDWLIVPTTGGEPVWKSLDDMANRTSIKVPNNTLQTSTAYTAKVRYHGAKYGWSAYTIVDFSTVAAFNVVNKPTITVSGAPDNIKETPTLTASAFGGTNVTHKSTDWQVLKASDNSVVWEKLGDTSNLLSIKVPKGNLQVSTGYIFKVRFNANEGVSSEYGEATYTTVAQFIRYNYIGVPGTSTFGVGLCTQEAYESVELEPAPNCENEGDFQYGLYVRGDFENNYGDGVALKYIPAFYIARLQTTASVTRINPLSGGGGSPASSETWRNLTDTELERLLPYVEVTKEQMKEAQRRSPYNAMVVAPLDKFTNELDANNHGFYLMRGFIDGGENKKGFFIANTLSTKHHYFGAGSSTHLLRCGNDNKDNYNVLFRSNTSYSEGRDPSAGNIFKEPQATNAKGNFISTLDGTPYQCCSIFAWAVISVLSLIQGQYATSISQCAWYDSTLVHNYPKGINQSTKDVDDATVTSNIVSNTEGSVFVTAGYEKTTHNGSITGITNVNGWIWQFTLGSWGDGSRLLKRSASIYDITYDNVDNSGASFWETHNISNISNQWGGTKSSFPDLAGADKDLFGIYAFGGNTSRNSNEFGSDYHQRFGGTSAVLVGSYYNDGSPAGVFYRHDDYWASSAHNGGFRAMAYPDPAIGGTGNDTVPPVVGGGGELVVVPNGPNSN